MVAKTRDPSRLVTQSQLKERLSYDPQIGEFRWIIAPPKAETGDVAGRPNSNGYLEVWLLGKRYQLHRLAVLYMTGSHPIDEVDHINGERTNNCWENLRQVTTQENSKNRKLSSRSRSGANGVRYHKDTGRWHASIGVDGKLVQLGAFRLKFEAKQARIAAEAKYGYHQNHGKR
ncbi:HNH endonuclease [Pseudomonas sp. Marseille-QA0892]